jgi:hypothetical protein
MGKDFYAEEWSEVEDETGEKQQIVVQQHVIIDHLVAEKLFCMGERVGDWGWKHKVWRQVPDIMFPTVQAAARYYYGWAEGSEKITKNDDGTVTYEAYYAAG